MIEQIKPTAEEAARHYAAALDSVAVINSNKPELVAAEEWADVVKRNVEHLQIMVAKDFWTTENLEPLYTAIAGK